MPSKPVRNQNYPLGVPKDRAWLRALTMYAKRRGMNRPECVRKMIDAQGGDELAELYEFEKRFEERKNERHAPAPVSRPV